VKKYIFYLSIIFLVTVSFFYLLKENSMKNLEDRYIQNSAKKLLASQNTYNKLSSYFFNNNNEIIADFLNRFLDANTTQKALIRDELTKKFFQTYRNLSLMGLNQFQFFTKDGKCILRFHHIKYFDDNLSLSRGSIQKSLQSYRFLQGFEVGSFSDGLRYIYPLFYDGEFIGGYEWSLSYSSLVDELKKIYNGWYILAIDKDILSQKMDVEEIEKNYRPLAGYPDLLYQKSNIKLYPKESMEFLKNLFLDMTLFDAIRSKKDIIKINSFAGDDFITFFKVINNIDGEPIGYFISINKTQKVREIEKIFLMEVFFSLIIIILIYLFLYKSHIDKLFMRTLIDSQKDLVVLTSGDKLEDANKRFLDFFGVSDVKEFRKEYGCLCNQFLEIDGHVPENSTRNGWLQKLLKMSDSDKKVVLFDNHRNEERIFIVSLSRFKDSSLYVVVLSDITEIEQEKHYFKTESMVDHLTKAYNKRTFEMQLQQKVHDTMNSKKESVALIMFDIDHFKSINDTFGHMSGDKVLIELATLVKESLGMDDSLYRWGGEEFAILMENSTLEKGVFFAESLRKRIESYEFPIERQVTCSFGVTTIRINDTKESVIDRADENLYRAKNSGRNRVEADKDRIIRSIFK